MLRRTSSNSFTAPTAVMKAIPAETWVGAPEAATLLNSTTGAESRDSITKSERTPDRVAKKYTEPGWGPAGGPKRGALTSV